MCGVCEHTPLQTCHGQRTISGNGFSSNGSPLWALGIILQVTNLLYWASSVVLTLTLMLLLNLKYTVIFNPLKLCFQLCLNMLFSSKVFTKVERTASLQMTEKEKFPHNCSLCTKQTKPRIKLQGANETTPAHVRQVRPQHSCSYKCLCAVRHRGLGKYHLWIALLKWC